jgi:hypothetical protein
VIPCPTTFPCCLKAPTYLGPICICCSLCLHYSGQFDSNRWPHFQFHPWGMEGLCLPCISPLSSNLGRYLKYPSFYKQSSTPKALDYAGISTSSHTRPLEGPQSTFNWSFARRWLENLFNDLGWVQRAPSYPWTPNGVVWTFHSIATWVPFRGGFQGGWVFLVYETSTNPTRVPWGESEQNGSIPCVSRGTKFPCTPPFGANMVTFFLFWFPSKWRSPTILLSWQPW